MPEKHVIQLPLNNVEVAALMAFASIGAEIVEKISTEGALSPFFPYCCRDHIDMWNVVAISFNNLTPDGWRELIDRVQKLVEAGIPNAEILRL